MPSEPAAVVLLSGGLDSATTLWIARARGFRCHALLVDYGQRHRRELEAARRVARAAGCPAQVVRLRLPWGGSALTDRRMAVPVGRTMAQMARGIPPTYVPARNTLFLSLALGCAETLGATHLFIGANAIDFSLGAGSPILVRGRGYLPVEQCRVGDHIIAMNPRTLELGWHTVAHVIEHPYRSQPMYELTTEHGRRLIVSGGHSLFGLNDVGEVRPVPVQNLQPGDYIVAAGRTPISDRAVPKINLVNLLGNAPHTYVSHPNIPRWIGGYRNERERSWQRTQTLPIQVFRARFRRKINHGSLMVRTKTRGRATEISATFTLTAEWAFFLGLWLADGSYGRATVQISCSAPEAQPVLGWIAERFHVKVSVSPNQIDRTIASRLLADTMKGLGFSGTSRTKRIPPAVFGWPAPLQAAFVKGFIVGDGSIDACGPITLSSVNRELLRGFHDLLLNLGVVAYRRCTSVKKTNFTSRPFTLYSLVVENSDDKRRLLNATGPFHQMTALHTPRSKIHGIPVYPRLNEQLKSYQAGPAMTRVKNAIRNNAIYSGNRFQRELLAQLLPSVPHPWMVETWERLIHNDIIFAKIRSKRRVQYHGSAIYDLSVPSCENFLCDGVVAHNSGYPDCRPAFYRAFAQAARRGTKAGVEGRPIRIETPLIRLTKAQIIRRGLRLGVPYALTWSCYLGGRRPCGRCDSCRLRAKGFREADVADPALA